MTSQTAELLRYKSRWYAMERDPLNGHSVPDRTSSSSLRGYKTAWEIVDNRLYQTELTGVPEDSTRVDLPAETNVLDRVFLDCYSGTVQCPLGIGHEVTKGCVEHPAHLVITVERGVIQGAKEVRNLRFDQHFDLANDTPGIRDDSYFVVRKDHMELHYRDQRGNHLQKSAPPFNLLSLPVFADFVLRFSKYAPYLRQVERIRMGKTSDYEGFPLEDKYCFVFGDSNSDDARTMLLVTFQNSWHETDYDYVAMTAADRSTAYKSKPAGPERDTKFKIHAAQFSRRRGGGQVWFVAEMQRFKALLDRLDAATQTLQSWADSGHSMRVNCSGFFVCGREPVDIPPARLRLFAEKGWSIEEFKQKLKCRGCGSLASDINVFPTTDEAHKK